MDLFHDSIRVWVIGWSYWSLILQLRKGGLPPLISEWVGPGRDLVMLVVFFERLGPLRMM